MTKLQKGLLLALIAFIFYGLQPYYTKPLLAIGMSNESILFYRNLFGALPLALFMIVKRTSFRLSLRELVTLIFLAFISDGACLFYNEGFTDNRLPTGIASTIQFLYPIITALIMIMFYKEKCRRSTLVALILAVGGVAFLSWPSEQSQIKLIGVFFELLSAFCYGFYIVRLNHSRVSNMDGTKLTFYVLFIGSLIFAGEGLRVDQLQGIHTFEEWKYVLILAVFCTTIVNLLIVLCARLIGSTLTSMFGALGPLTAIITGLLFLGEEMTVSIGVGIVCILSAVLLIIYANRPKK